MTVSPSVCHSETTLSAGPDGVAAPVYLDCCATTPPVPEVLKEMHHFLAVEYGNEGSRTHAYGAAARRRVNQAREEIALLAAAKADEVIFTSGATESNNLAILGLASWMEAHGRRHIVTSSLEHKAVLEPTAVLEERGFEVTRLASDESGAVDPAEVLAALRVDTGLVSLMHVNNETGVLQDLTAIAEGLPDSVFFHADAAQGFGKEFDQIGHPRIDLISASAHKLHGPKGIGVLIARRRAFTRPPLSPLMHGGGQQLGLRPGTIPVHLVAGFGVAARLASKERRERLSANRSFRSRALVGLAPLGPLVNGDPERALPHILNVSLPGIDGEAALVATKDLVALSNGSACTSRNYEPSHVLGAMGLSHERTASALRVSWCHFTPEPPWRELVRRLIRLRS